MKNIFYTLALLVCFSSFGQTLKEVNDNLQKYDGLLQQYANSGDYKSAIELGKKMLQTDFVKSNNLPRAIMFQNLGEYYGQLSLNSKGSSEFLIKANEYYNKAIATKDCPAWLLTDCYIGLGTFNGNNQTGLNYNDLAIYVIEKHPDRASISNETKGMAYTNKAVKLYQMGYKIKKVCKAIKKANQFSRDYPRAGELMIKLGCY